MEEVIFSGSASKKPKGMAEVTIVISGMSGSGYRGDEDPTCTDTISVTRRLYRSGESEYMINRSACRLKDIRDLFLDTGLEVKSYSILEQDRIAEILNAKPIERRIIIEEVAGVMKYNARRKEAMAKLESSRSNLQRINDIILEVKKQIALLDRFAKKAERFKKLTSEIHGIELKIAKRDYQTLKNVFHDIVTEYNGIKEREVLMKSELSTIENDTETKRIAVVALEKELERIQNAFADLEKEIALIEREIAIARTEKENFQEYLTKLHAQEAEYSDKERELDLRKETLEASEREFTEEIEKKEKVFAERNDRMQEVEDALSQLEEELEHRRKDLFKFSEELSNIRNVYNKQQTVLEGLKYREEGSIKDADNVKRSLSELDSLLKDVESKLLMRGNDVLLLKDQKARKIGELSSFREKAEQVRASLSTCREELASYSARIESLGEVMFNDATREFLSKDLHFEIIASLTDILEVENKYEKAIESVLSDKVNAFILSSYEDIRRAVAGLKEKGLERTAFIPLHSPVVSEEKSAPRGALGWARNFVQTSEQYRHIADNILENVCIVDDLQTGIDLLASGSRSVFVTLDGDVIESTGSIVAGETRGFFKRKREIREAENAREETRRKIGQLQTSLHTIQQNIEAREKELKTIESAIVENEKELSMLKMTAENLRDEKEKKSKKLAYLSLEIEQISREKAVLEKDIGEKEEEVRRIETKKKEIEEQSASLSEEITGKRAILADFRAEITDIRLSSTSLRERLDSVSKEKESVIREATANREKMHYLREEITSTELRISQRDRELAEFEQKMRVLVAEADRFRKDITERKDVIDAENGALASVNQRLKVLRKDVEALSQRLTELDVRKTEYRIKMENLHEQIRQNYGLAIDVIDVELPTKEDEARLLDLREKIQELGQVNLGSIEEYEELRERYEFLKNQQDDLARSIAELEEAITKINVTTRRKLREAFEALNAKFSEVFVSLFSGGKAELIMTDENNILETGIDIIAQPPGKRLQNINLLSGGEKALTALALLFASFLIKPTPLCVLDEADSALDEVNTDKFAAMVKDFSKDTQFIVVSHNRNTMSIADYIYGITMEEPGVSKVISMQLVEA